MFAVTQAKTFLPVIRAKHLTKVIQRETKPELFLLQFIWQLGVTDNI